MNIPNFINTKMVDGEGYLTSNWKTVLSTLITQLQINLSDEGYIIPQQPRSNIEKFKIPEKKGLIILDSDSETLKVNLDGSQIKTIQTV